MKARLIFHLKSYHYLSQFHLTGDYGLKRYFIRAFNQNQLTGDVTYSDPIYRTTWLYALDYLGSEMAARETFGFFLDDGSIGAHSKFKDHIYEGVEKMRFGVERRERVMLIMMATVAKVLVYSMKIVARRTELADPSYLLNG